MRIFLVNKKETLVDASHKIMIDIPIIAFKGGIN